MTNSAYKSLSPLIPEGDYCYSYTGRVVIDNMIIDSHGNRVLSDYYFKPEIKPCPFWKSTHDGALCTYLMVESKETEVSSLIWDQIKECDANTNNELTLFELELNRDSQLPVQLARKHTKRNPNFIQSLILILKDSKDNSFKYDGTTYTLAQHLLTK